MTLEFENSNDDAGTATAEGLLGLEGGEGTPDGSNNDSGGDGGDGDASEAPPRSFAELNEAANQKSFKMTKDETLRMQTAIKHGLKSDEDIDRVLAEEKDASSQKPKKGTKSNPKPNTVSNKDPESDDDDGAGKEDEDGKPKAKADDADTDDDDDEEFDVDSQLLKVIAPHLDKADSVEDAVKAIKNLQHDAGRKGEFVNKAKKLGIASTEDLEKVVTTMNSIDATIKEKLSSPEGLQELFKAYGIAPPNGQPAQANGQPAPASTDGEQADLNTFLSKFEDDGYIEVSKFKEMVPALTQSIRTDIEKEYGPMKEQLTQLGGLFKNIQAQAAQKAQFDALWEDADGVSSAFGEHDASLLLNTPAREIYEESIDGNGKLKAQPHAEFATLQKLIKLRQLAVADAQKRSETLGYKVQPDVLGYLSKVFVTKGGLKKLMGKTGKSAANTLAANLSRKIQQNRPHKKSAGSEGFKVPKTAEDIKKMTPAQKGKFLQKLRRGSLKIDV